MNMINKPKFWDKKNSKLLSLFFQPLTIPIRISNLISNIKPKKKFKKIKSICVGNIYLGGTGKTPSTIKIFDILKKNGLKVVMGKKNYDSHEDEKIVLEKNGKLISDQNRTKVFKRSIEKNYECIIFDDGLQDLTVDYDIKIVCFDSLNWIGNGNLIPSGPMREKLTSLKKYDVIFLKNYNEDLRMILNEIKFHNPKIEIFKTNYKILNIEKFDLNTKYICVSGIGNPASFKKILLDNKFQIIDEIIFPDHMLYSKNDINYIEDRARKINAKIITTEKDYVKLSKLVNTQIDFLDISLEIDNEKSLIDLLNLKLHE